MILKRCAASGSECARSRASVQSTRRTYFQNRFLIDRNLGGMSWVKVPIPEWVDGKVGQQNIIVNVDSLHPVEHEANAPLRFMSFDIECLPNHGEMPKAESSPVILISMAFEPEYQGQKDLVLVGKDIDCPRRIYGHVRMSTTF